MVCSALELLQHKAGGEQQAGAAAPSGPQQQSYTLQLDGLGYT